MAKKTNQSSSRSTTDQTGAGAGTVQSGAGAQTGQASAGAGTGRAAVGSAYESSGAETISDIGQAEAYTVNMKRQVAGELTTDKLLDQVSVVSAQRKARNAEDFDQSLRNITLQSVQAAVALQTRIAANAVSLDEMLHGVSHAERERTTRIGDIAEIIREAALSDNPVLQDLITAAAAKAAEKIKGKTATA